MFTCRTVKLVRLCCGLVLEGVLLCYGLVSNDKFMAIEGDKVNNDGNVCLEVIPKCSLKIINCEMV